jgi:adenylate cyclase class 2
VLEVEIKARVDAPRDTARALRQAGFASAGEVYEKDIYFNGPDRDFRKTDEALRLRARISVDGGVKNHITYKGPKQKADAKTREEIETGIASYEDMQAILRRLGYRPSVTVSKKRGYYKYHGGGAAESIAAGDVTICLDEVEGLGSYIELELMMEDGEDGAAAGETLSRLLSLLRIDQNACTQKSYAQLVFEGTSERRRPFGEA